jgi:hypothetical protein
MEVEGGDKEADWAADKSFRNCLDTLRAQQSALEILANLCTVSGADDEEDENWQDNPSDNEEDEEVDDQAGGDVEAAAPVAPVALLEAVVAHNLVRLVLERANGLPENVVQLLSASANVSLYYIRIIFVFVFTYLHISQYFCLKAMDLAESPASP